MDMQHALLLKKGDRVIAMEGWYAPEMITREKVYILIEDARPLILSGDNEIRNVFLPIIDDMNRVRYPTYHGFDITSS